MEINKALDQIEQIHQHLARSEVCRDWRSGPVATGGALALVAAALQGLLLGPLPGSRLFILYWLAVAALAMLVGGFGLAQSWRAGGDSFTRRRTLTLVGQFFPSLAAGALVTAALAGRGPGVVALLPGLWAILFGLGNFAARPYLPRHVGWVGLYYLVAGAVLLAMAGGGGQPSPWWMGLSFGPGQLLGGLVLYWNLERKGGVR